MNERNPVKDTMASPFSRTSWPDTRLGYHVLMNSRRYGTSCFACPTGEEAAQTLAWLALRAQQQQRQDGAQRFFCLLPPDLNTDEPGVSSVYGPDTPESEDALVVCVADGALQWIAGDGLDERPLIVLDVVGSEAEGPFICWQACPRPLASIKPPHRHTVSRYLQLRHLQQQAERALGSEEKEGEDVDPVTVAWQRDHPDALLPPLSLAAIGEPQSAPEGAASTPTEARQ